MKSPTLTSTLALVTACVTTCAAQGIQFRNTSFSTTVRVGQVWPVSWTEGNGQPVTLSIGNSSWNVPLFVQKPVSPSTFALTISASPGFVSGVYQLALAQLDNPAGTTYSPYFNVVVPEGTADTGGDTDTDTDAVAGTITPTDTGLVPTATGWVPVKTITVTYVYVDEKCGCTRTTSVASPLGTGVPHTTYSWWNEECACTKSAVVPIIPAPNVNNNNNNYTAPVAPPTAPASGAPTYGEGSVATGTATIGQTPKVFTGDARKLSASMLGMIVLVAGAMSA